MVYIYIQITVKDIKYYLQLGPLDATYATSRIAPRKFSSIDEFGFGQVIAFGGFDVVFDLA